MHNRLLIAGALLVGAPAGAQVVTEMTPELVRQAIADTKGKGCYPLEAGGGVGREKVWGGRSRTPSAVKCGVVTQQKSRNRPQAIPPTRGEATTSRYSNLFGATWEAEGMVA